MNSKSLKWIGVILILIFIGLLLADPYIFNPDEEKASEEVLKKELHEN